MLSDGIFVTPIAPATLEFGGQPAAIFPVAATRRGRHREHACRSGAPGGPAAREAEHRVRARHHQLHDPVHGLTSCRLLATANVALPTEVAEIVNPQLTDNEAGTVTITGIAQLSEASALVLNTLFQTDIFYAGFQLGFIRSTLTVRRPDRSQRIPASQGRDAAAGLARPGLPGMRDAEQHPRRPARLTIVRATATELAERDRRDAGRERPARELVRQRALQGPRRQPLEHGGRRRRPHRRVQHRRSVALGPDRLHGRAAGRRPGADHRPAQLDRATDLPGGHDRDRAGHTAFHPGPVHGHGHDRPAPSVPPPRPRTRSCPGSWSRTAARSGSSTA